MESWMYITKFIIADFKPMAHLSTRRVEVNHIQNMLLILGANGSGKSSVLREMTPLPSTSTDFGKQGMKSISFTHRGADYTVTSDFASKLRTHSFIKNGTELNQSGNSGTQTELCAQHLGLTPVIEDIMNLRYNITKMNRSERKALLMSMYPSDLTFVLNYHKKIKSELNGFNINLKTFKERQATLLSKVMDDEQLQSIYTLRAELHQTNICMDQILFALNKEIELYLNHTANKPVSLTEDLTIDKIRQECTSIIGQMIKLRNRYPQLFNDRDIVMTNKVLCANQESISQQQRQLMDSANGIKEEIEKFEQCIGVDIETEIAELTQLCASLTKMIGEIVIDPTIPILELHELETVKSTTLPRFNELLTGVHQVGKLWSLANLTKVERKMEQYKLESGQAIRELEFVEQKLQRVEAGIQQETLVLYPKDCTTVCSLRTSKVDRLNLLTIEQQKILAEKTKIVKLIETLKRRCEHLKTAYQGPCTGKPFIEQISDMITYTSWGCFVLNREDLISALNQHPFKLNHRLMQIVNNSEQQKILNQYRQELATNMFKLTTLKAARLPAKDLIMRTLLEKQIVLAKLTEDYQRTTIKHTNITTDIQVTNHIIKLGDRINDLQERHIKYANYKIIDGHITCLRGFINECKQHKVIVLQKLQETEQIVKDQENLLARLKGEINPAIAEYTKKQQEWSLVESALNPAHGLPHIYTVRFINSLIININKIIKAVWSSDLELTLLSEKEPLDFSLPFTVNRGCSIKDIDVGSKGQQEIIDLAFILASFVQMGLGKDYPLKLDEPDGALSHDHRTSLLALLTNLLRNGELTQLMLINHHASAYSSFAHCQILCLCAEGIILPATGVNENIAIE